LENLQRKEEEMVRHADRLEIALEERATELEIVRAEVKTVIIKMAIVWRTTCIH
jgi:hypothetical protein